MFYSFEEFLVANGIVLGDYLLPPLASFATLSVLCLRL